MFCSKCGKQNPDGAKFCQNCGNTITAVKQSMGAGQGVGNTQHGMGQQAPQPSGMQMRPPQMNQGAQQVYQGMQQAPPQQGYQGVQQPTPVAMFARMGNPGQECVREAAVKPLFLVALIAFSAYVLFHLIDIFTQKNGIMEMISQLADSLGVSDLGSFDSGSSGKFTAFLGMLPAILIATGLWMTFAAAQNRQNQMMGTAGLTMVKVITIIQMVFYCIRMLLSEIALFIVLKAVSSASKAASKAASELGGYGYGGYGGYGYGGYGSYGQAVDQAAGIGKGMIVFFIIVVLIAMVLGFMFYLKAIASIDAAKDMAKTGSSTKSSSSYVAVFCLIGGIAMILYALLMNSILSMISKAIYISLEMSGWQLASQFARGLSVFLFGLVLIQFKKHRELWKA